MVVDLPSPGPALVMTNEREPAPASTPTNCRLVRRVRKDSARGFIGSACTMSGRFLASASNAMPPRSGLSVTTSMSWIEWMRVSSTVRSTANAMPRARPSSAPSATLSGKFGLDVAVGTSAGSIVSMRTRLAASPSGFSSRFTTTSAKFLPTELAIAAACSGFGSLTVAEMMTVFAGTDAVT